MPEIPTSESIYRASCEFMPGGVNSPVRACRAVGTIPRCITSASYQFITDVDQRIYTDYVCSWGASILGHAEDHVVRAVKKACSRGLTFGAPTPEELQLAELVCKLVPGISMMRMVNSGTEAVMSAIRVARGYTHRDLILKFEGCYHGHSDGMLVKAGSGALTVGVPDSAGVPADYAKLTLVAPYNDLEAVERLFKEYPGKIAAVIVEPVAANMGVVLPKRGFLNGLRKLTQADGALLIFDEIITGFRLGLGGAQELFNVKPDLTTLGKIVGGGLPAAIYGGRRDIMQCVAPVGPVYQAGTLSGNPLATAAGIATLEILEKKAKRLYPSLAKMTDELARGLEEVSRGDIEVPHIGSMFSVRFGDRLQRYGRTPDEKYAAWYRHMVSHLIYVAPSRFESMFVSAEHTDREIHATIEAARSFFR